MIERLANDEGAVRVDLTDGDAQLMKGRHGIEAGYNAQAMVSPIDPAKAEGDGFFITAADVANAADDYGQLLPLMEQAEDGLGGTIPAQTRHPECA